MKNLWIILLLANSILLSSCEDEIDVDLDEGASQLVVDAFLTNDSSEQKIRITRTAPYFLNRPTEGVVGASVIVRGPNNLQINFQDEGNGNYIYDAKLNPPIDSTGFPYSLEFQYDGELYTATSVLSPVPNVDSMSFEFQKGELGSEEGYYTQFWARDFAGRKDYYWIKGFRNGEDITPDDPSDIVLSEDAAFSGEGADGFIFIRPLRSSITSDDEPFKAGDLSSVELLSLNEDAYIFLAQVRTQANNGGLFSTPPVNIRSNIKDANGNLQDKVLGVFSLSSISRNSIQIQP